MSDQPIGIIVHFLGAVGSRVGCRTFDATKLPTQSSTVRHVVSLSETLSALLHSIQLNN